MKVKKRKGTRTSRRQGIKTVRAQLDRRQVYREQLDRRADKTKGA